MEHRLSIRATLSRMWMKEILKFLVYLDRLCLLIYIGYRFQASAPEKGRGRRIHAGLEAGVERDSETNALFY